MTSEISYEEVFSPERNKFFKQGGFRSSNYKRAKSHFNKKAMKEDNRSGIETGLEVLTELSEEVDKIYSEAKIFKETGNKPEDIRSQLNETVAHCEYQVQEAKIENKPLNFLAETLYDPNFILKASISRNPSILRTIQSLEEMYHNSMYSDRPRIQNDIQCFVKSVMRT